MRAVILDLDDTLYPERRFALSGFAAVSEEVARVAGSPACDVFRACVSALRSGQRTDAFQHVCRRFGLGTDVVPSLVATYRSHVPSLRVPRSTRRLLESLRPSCRLAILTNGIPAVQRGKVAALDLERLVDVVVYAHAHGEGTGKPDPAVFLHALSELGVPPHRAVMVGDDPAGDIAGARASGMWTVRVQRGPHRTRPAVAGAEPHLTVTTLGEVPGAVARLVQGRA